MSLCRFSSDNWKSDVYVYDDVSGGYTTHVAANRVVGDIPDASYAPDKDLDQWASELQKQHEFLSAAERKTIGLPYDGQTFNDEDLEGLRDRLLLLKEKGYRVPEGIIELIEEGIRDSDNDEITAVQTHGRVREMIHPPFQYEGESDE